MYRDDHKVASKRRSMLVCNGEIESINLRITDLRWSLDSTTPSVTEDDLRRAVDKLQHKTKELHVLRLELFDLENPGNGPDDIPF